MPNQGKSVVSLSDPPALRRCLTDRNAPTHIPLTLPECQAEPLIELGHQVLKLARKSRDDLDGDFIRYLTIKRPAIPPAIAVCVSASPPSEMASRMADSTLSLSRNAVIASGTGP